MSGLLTDTLPNAFDSQPTPRAGTKTYQPGDVGGSVPLWSASHHRSTSVEYFSRHYSNPEQHGNNFGVFSSCHQSVPVQDHRNPNPLTTTLLQSNYRAGNLNSTHIQIGGDLQYLPAYQELSSTALPPLPQLRIDDHLPLVDASVLASARNIVDPLEPKPATPSENSLARDAEAWSPSSRESPLETTRRRPRREKPHIDLAPDQPPTTQGKARARVYVACIQCRNRKIRCDGAKPMCHNCGLRTNKTEECSYDALPKRRGPDKTPGARQRMARDVRNEIDNSMIQKRQRRGRRDAPASSESDLHASPRRGQDSSNPASQTRTHATTNLPMPISFTSLTSSHNLHSQDDYKAAPNLVRSLDPRYLSECGCRGSLTCQNPIESIAFAQPVTRIPPSYEDSLVRECDCLTPVPFCASAQGYITQLDDDGNEQQQDGTNNNSIATEPSLDFTRKIWWDSLLSLYSSPTSGPLQTLTHSQRDLAAQNITSDLRFLFRASNYWFCFFHIPSFFGNFFDPLRRARLQPGLVLAALAMATFWQSSEVGGGARGRERALRFRDEAQSAVEASFNAGWVDETLAQAAWLLALFEVCAHPWHSSERSTSSMVMLDSIIRSLSLTLIDADDPHASLFYPRSVPAVSERSPRRSWSSGSVGDSSYPLLSNLNPPFSHSHSHSSPVTDVESGCSCRSLTLGEHWAPALEHAPLWASTPTWNSAWSEGEIRKESCRRLCWSSMTLAAGHISYATAHKSTWPDLFIADPSNYALLFSGELTTRSLAASSPYSSKDTIWALYERSFLLWHSCARMRVNGSATEAEQAHFAVTAWLEADTLEAALNRHTCGIERAFIFHGREYIFNTRMCISYEFQRFVPLVTANVNGLFHRKKAEDWLSHQAVVAQRFMSGLHTITGYSSSRLARRPFFVFWFMGQVSRALSLWHCDNTLTVALDVCKAFLAPIDYLTALWPCAEQRHLYQRLRERLDTACYVAGIPSPPPPNLSLPAPSSLLSLI